MHDVDTYILSCIVFTYQYTRIFHCYLYSIQELASGIKIFNGSSAVHWFIQNMEGVSSLQKAQVCVYLYDVNPNYYNCVYTWLINSITLDSYVYMSKICWDGSAKMQYQSVIAMHAR